MKTNRTAETIAVAPNLDLPLSLAAASAFPRRLRHA